MARITQIPTVQRIADRALAWVEECLGALRQWVRERDPSNTEGNYLDKFVTREELKKLNLVVLNAQGELVPYALFAAGSAEAPSVASVGNAATGIYWPAENKVAVATNKTLRTLFDDAGRVLIGQATHTDAAVNGSLEISNTSSDVFFLTRYQADTGAPNIVLSKSRGAAVGTNTIVQNGDLLGTIVFRGANGTGFSNAAFIRAEVDGAPGASSDMPGRIGLWTSADASSSPTERMRITSAGDVGIGVTPSVRLHVDSGSTSEALRLNSSSNTFLSLHRSGTRRAYVQSASGGMYLVQEENLPLLIYTNNVNIGQFSAAGDCHMFGQVRAGGWRGGSLGTLDGLAVEMGVSSGVGYMLTFNRGSSTYGALWIQGSDVVLGDTAGVARLRMIPTTFDIVKRLTATAPTLSNNLDMVMNLTSDTNLRISARGSDGTTRVANITLA